MNEPDMLELLDIDTEDELLQVPAVMPPMPVVDPIGAADNDIRRATDPYLWAFETLDPGGIVFDPERAQEGPCTVIPLGMNEHGTESELVFHKGIIGALDDEQQALFCAQREVKQPSAREVENINRFKRAAELCAAVEPSQPGDDILPLRISCLETELRKHGTEL